MKTKQINTGVAEIILVELPEGAYMVNINTHSFVGLHYMLYEDGVNTPYKERLPDGNWSILSRADEVTNGTLSGVVKSIPHHIGFHRVYKDYKGKYTFPSESYVFENQVESLDSLFEYNGVYWENPLGVSYAKMPESDMDYRSFLMWKEAQQNVWEKSRTYILIKQK